MNKIVCFYWQGDRWQETTGGPLPSDLSYLKHLNRVGSVSKEMAARYVNNLYTGAKRFTKVPFEFICFTNEPLPDLLPGIEKRPFKQITNKGVLPRMYMFSQEAGLFGEQVLCLDLDVIITGSLDNMLLYKGPFCTRKSWTRGEETLIDGDIMSFRSNHAMASLFWEPLVSNTESVVKRTQGRERIWVREVMEGSDVDTWQEVLPGQVCSYKFHVMREKKVPQGARIISCHGYPRPHQIEDEWRMDYWK